MRKVRILSVILFLAAAAVFGIYKFNELRVKDHVGPRVTMDSESVTVSAGAGEEALLSGIRAEDKKDGDVTDSLLVESMSNFIEKGRRRITIAAFDSDSHVTKVSREVVYSDYHSPRFSLTGPLKFSMGTENILSYLSAEDMLDGNLTNQIKISGEYSIKEDSPGDYPMMFTVANSAGDVVSLPVTVQIYETAKEKTVPQIALSDYLIYLTPGTEITPWDYVSEITLGGVTYTRAEDGVLYAPGGEAAITADNLAITENGDYNTPGVYEITYQMAGADGTVGTVRLVVVVSE